MNTLDFYQPLYDIFINKTHYFPGEKMIGKIYFKYPKKNIKKLELLMIPEYFWQLKTGKKNNGFHAPRNIYYDIDISNVKPYLDEKTKKEYCYLDFNITISNDYLPSFEYDSNKIEIHVRYQFRLIIDSFSYFNNYEKREFFFLVTAIPSFTNDLILFKEIKQNVKNFFLFDKGETGLKVFLPDVNFKYESNCDLLLNIDNTKGKLAVSEYKVVLRRIIKICSFLDGYNDKKEKEITSMVQKIKVNVGEDKQLNCKFLLKDNDYIKNNRYNSIYRKIPDVNYFMPSIDVRIISCQYEIGVSLVFETFVDYNHRPKVVLPIKIVHETLKEHLERNGINVDEDKSHQNTNSETNSTTQSSITPGNTQGNNNNNSINKNTDNGNKSIDDTSKNKLNSY